MNRSQNYPAFTRPYQSTCGMQWGKSLPSDAGEHSAQKEMPPAMAYVPAQCFGKTFDLCQGLQNGTIFPSLCKPFCGKRGIRKC